MVLILVLALLPVSVSGQTPDAAQGSLPESYDIHAYRVSQVFTREDRTAVAQTGAAIEEIGAGYIIVSATEMEASQIATLGTNATSYASTGLTKNTSYRYRVRAYNASGNSGYSNIALAKTLRR